MLLTRLYDPRLAQASYLIGCQRTGEAIVVDPTRDVERYLQAAAAEKLRITHVTETHIHADFVSGTRELARRTGARLLLSGEGGPDWRYGFTSTDGARLLRDTDSIEIGNVRLDVRHTPGHTPEHLVFIVTDTVATALPMGAITGDFIFVGDVGRPDLLETAAGMHGTMETSARTLYRSLRRFAAEFGDGLQLWPGHGAGSACGKSLGAVPASTLGYERAVNWAFLVPDEDAFVREVLAGQPEPPAYFARMKRINRDGPAILGARAPLDAPLDAAELQRLLGDAAAVVVDTRPAAAHAAGHVPGTLNIPHNASFITWAGWLLPDDRDVYLIVANDVNDANDANDAGKQTAEVARAALAAIGIDRVAGWFDSQVVREWAALTGDTLGAIDQTSAAELAPRLAAGDVHVIDVRGRAEWEAGHLPGVANVPVGHLLAHLDAIPRDRPVVLQCQGGGRSSIAASLLRRAGVTDVVNLAGGYGAWEREGLPVEHAERAAGTDAGGDS